MTLDTHFIAEDLHGTLRNLKSTLFDPKMFQFCLTEMVAWSNIIPSKIMIKIICRLRYSNLPLIIPGLIQLPKGFKEGMEGLTYELKKCYFIKATYFLWKRIKKHFAIPAVF